MALKVGEMFVELGLKMNNFSKGIEDMQKSLRDVADDMKTVGTTLSATVTAPLVGMGAASLKAFGDFEQGMNKVKAVTQQTGAAFDAMEQTALELGRTTQFTASQAADAMGFLAMAGFKANEIISAMPSTLQLAAAGAMDLGRAADITSNILTGYGLAVEQLNHANDVLVTGMTNTNVDLSMLGESFKYVGPVAKAAGLQFEETAAAIGLLGNAGIQGSMAGTALRKAITSLIAPSKQQAEIMESLGLSVVDTYGRMKSLAEVVRQLEQSGASAADIMKLFGQRAGPGMQALVDQGAEAIERLTKKMEDSEGIAKRVAETQLEGWKGAMTKLKSALEGTLIAVGDALAPMATRLAEFFTGLSGKITAMAELFKGLPQPIQNSVIAFGALAAAIGPVILIFGHLVGAAANLKSLGPLLAGVAKHMMTFGASAKNIGVGSAALKSLSGIAAIAAPALTALGIAIAAIAAIEVGKGIANVADAIFGISKASKEAKQTTEEMADAIKSAERRQQELQQAMADAGRGVRELDDRMKGSLRTIGEYKTVWEQLKDAVLNAIAPWRGARQALDDLAYMIRLVKNDTKDMGDVVVREVKRMQDAVLRKAKAQADEQMAMIELRRELKKREEAERQAAKAIEATARAEEAKAEAGRKAERELQARLDMLKRYEEGAKNYIRAQEKIAQMDEQIARENKELADTFRQIEIEMSKVAVVPEEIAVKLETRLGPAIYGRIQEAQELSSAFEYLGITATQSVVAGAEKTAAAFDKVKAAYESGRATAQDFYQALLKNLEAQLAVAEATGKSTEEIVTNIDATKTKLQELGVDLEKNVAKTNEWGEAWTTVSTALTDMAGQISDLIWEGGNLGEIFISTFKEIGKTITRLALETIAHDLVNSLKAGEGALMAFGNALKKIFGVGGSAGSAGGSIKKGVTGLMGEIGKLSNIVSAVTGIVDAVFGALSYFQGRRMEKDIGRIEVTSREIKNVTLDQLARFDEFLPWLAELKYLGSIDKYALAMLDRMGGGGASGNEATGAQEDLAEATEEATEKTEELADEVKDLADTAEDAAEKIDEASDVQSDYSKQVHSYNDTVQDVTDSTEDLTDALGDQETQEQKLRREAQERYDAEKRGLQDVSRASDTYTRTLSDTSRSIQAGITSLNSGMSDFAVNAKYAGEEIRKASNNLKSAAGSVGAISGGNPITVAGPNGPIPQPGSGGGNSPSPGNNPGASFFDPWEQTRFYTDSQTGNNYGNQNLQLEVTVNNADANDVANKMMDTWRRRGVDL